MPLNQPSPLQLTELGERYHWRAGSGDWTAVQAIIDRQEPVQVIQEAGSTLWYAHLPPEHPFYFGFPDFPPDPTLPVPPTPQARIWISPMQRRFAETGIPRVQWHPPVLWIGVGYNRGVLPAQIETAIAEVCQSFHLAVAAIAGLATLDRKLADTTLLEVCNRNGWQLRGFSAMELQRYTPENPSPEVAAYVGTPSVAEAAAMLAAQTAWVEPSLRVRKQIVRFAAGAVTVAIAQSRFPELTDEHNPGINSSIP